MLNTIDRNTIFSPLIRNIFIPIKYDCYIQVDIYKKISILVDFILFDAIQYHHEKYCDTALY